MTEGEGISALRLQETKAITEKATEVTRSITGGPRFIESDSRNPLIQNLLKASAVAEHKSQMMRIHGQDESSLFSVLTDEEQKELSSLLDKLLSEWAKGHASHHVGRD